MTTRAGAGAARAPRRDAVRNDRLVLDAARSVFAEQGPQAGMEDVARRAGVGVASIYRRFPSKDALLAAIAQLFAEELDEAADAALADDDPGRGLTAFLEYVGAFNAEKRRYASELVDRAADDDLAAVIEAKVDRLTADAVTVGALARGVRGRDVRALIAALRGVVASSPDEEEWRRFLRVHLAGLRDVDGSSGDSPTPRTSGR